MKKIVILLVLITAFMTNINSQPCLSGGINFSTQSMIDNFQTNYPNCDIIEGDVRILGDDITNLGGLNSITGINGHLEIWMNPSLVNLSGLSNLTYVGDFLYISENPLLVNFTGLNNLETIGGYLGIEMNNQITNFLGFERLQSIGGYFDVSLNENLVNFSGINNLVSLGEDLSFYANNSLVSLAGLENISSDVTHIILLNNPVLTDLTGLHNINSISVTLGIRNNNLLSDLSDLENIKLDGMQNLVVKNNPLLSECEIQNICNYLSASTGNIEISENAVGCNNQQEVQLACFSGSQDYNISLKPEVYPNPAKNILFIRSNGDLIEQAVLYDTFGRKIIEQKNNVENINIANVESGFYVLELEVNELIFRKKILIIE
ncbi:MAG: T9SS type A sorting domain-containing protein [Bacteroidetes bacterium]|nr:T9SS type A sorting domain-containing protein [Bacteroidota bacterium]